ncbi:hypothetical protein Aperf_G00000125910 [Anoplocephala perfoliata]
MLSGIPTDRRSTVLVKGNLTTCYWRCTRTTKANYYTISLEIAYSSKELGYFWMEFSGSLHDEPFRYGLGPKAELFMVIRDAIMQYSNNIWHAEDITNRTSSTNINRVMETLDFNTPAKVQNQTSSERTGHLIQPLSSNPFWTPPELIEDVVSTDT